MSDLSVFLPPPAVPSKIWLVAVIGSYQRIFQACAFLAGPNGAQEFALEQINYLRRPAGLPDAENPYQWQAALDEWREAQQRQLGLEAGVPLPDEDDVVVIVRELEVRTDFDVY